MLLCANPYRPSTVLPDETNPMGVLEDRIVSDLEEILSLSFIRRYGVEKGELVESLTEGRCALVPVYGRPEELEEAALFSSVYGVSDLVYVTPRKDEGKVSEDSLTGKRIAVVKDLHADEVISRTFIHRYEILRYESVEQGLRAVAYGQADAFLGSRTQAVTFMESRGIRNLIVSQSGLDPIQHRLAVSRRFPELYDEIQEILERSEFLYFDHGREDGLQPEDGDLSSEDRASSDRTLLFKGDWDYPPYEYLDDEGIPAGFNVDIVQAAARAVGLELFIELGPWDMVRQELREGRIDGLMGMFQTAEREKQADFAIPHFIASYAVFVRKDSEITQLEDLYGKTVLVQQDDLGHDFLMENMIAERVVVRDSPEDTLKSLSDGVGDAALLSRLQGGLLIKQERLRNIQIVGPPILQRNYCIAVPEGESRLLAQINEGLNMIKTDGTFQDIHNKWFGLYDGNFVDNRRIYRIISLFFLVILVLLLGFILWNMSLKREVAGKTRELKESGERLKLTLSSIGDAVITTDTEGKITSMNHTAAELTGWTMEDAPGSPLSTVFKIIDRNNRNPLPYAPDRLKAGEGAIKTPVILVNKKGKELLIDESASPILTESEEVLGMILVFRNKTEEVLMQERFQQAQKMQAVGELAGGIAHDFNNMLAGILGGTELLALCIDKESREAQFLNMIQSASHRAADLVKKLLTFARPVPSDKKLMELYKPLSDALTLLERSADPRIRRRKYFENTALWINGDYSQLQNAFLNLMINACHAMPQGGDLTIRVRTVELMEPSVGAMGLSLEPGTYAELKFEDNGMGIPQAIQSRIFEPFFTTRGQGEGTGLGLASVFAAVKQHHGSISVESSPGQGTVFSILLPLSTEPAVQKDKKEGTYRADDGSTVLVVDDESNVRLAAAGMMSEMNFSVLEAENGLEALNIFKECAEDITLVLLDLTMPEMNGMDCFRELKAMEPGIKIILSSGYIINDDVSLMKSEGLAGFIKKPYSYAELSDEVSRVMEG